MHISASTFTDPTMRPKLQAFYENKKAAAIEQIRARENEPLHEGKIKMPDGSEQTLTPIRFTAEMAEKMFASFDQWADFQAKSFDNGGFGPKRLEMAQKQLDSLQENHPDTKSNVRTTFSNDGALLAYINADGSVVTHGGSQKLIDPILDKANALGLSGQSRVNYLQTEIEKAMAGKYPKLDVTHYSDKDMPTKREFADMWYPDHDVDQHYNSALREARAAMESARAWHDQWQKNMNEMRDFLLTLQESA